MEHITNCPVCKSTNIKNHITVTDHFLSKEGFSISICESCEFLFTNPRPSSRELVNYYISDDYISHGKSKSLTIEFLYSVVRKYSLLKKFQLITNHSYGNTILDIGCGTGDFLSFFKKRGWKTFGIEPALDPRNYGKTKLNLEIEEETFLDTISSASFDVITMWHVLEHVSDINNRISQIKRIIKNDGLMVFALPNNKSWDCKHYDSFWSAWDVPRHLSHFSQSTFQKFIHYHDLELVETIPMKFDSFYVSLLSEKYSGSSLVFWNAFKNGFKSNYYAKHHSNDFSSLIFIVKKR